MFAKKGYAINGQPTPPSSPVSAILIHEWIVSTIQAIKSLHHLLMIFSIAIMVNPI